MLDLHFAEVMQAFGPVANLAENFGHGSGNQYVSAIAAVHYALGDVDSAARHVAVEVNICDTIDRSGVHSHADADLWGCGGQSAAQFQGTPHRGLDVAKEDQGHAIAGGQRNEPVLFLGTTNFRRAQDDFLKVAQQLPFLAHGQQRKAHDVQKQHMGHLEYRRCT